MRAGRVSRSRSLSPSARAFTLVELVVVIAIGLLLVVATIPAIGPMMESRDLAQGGQMIVDQIVTARQLASARNTTVEVCLVKLDQGAAGYSGIELRTFDASGTAVTLFPLSPLPRGICIAEAARLSPLLRLPGMGGGVLRAGGASVPYVSFKVRSSGVVEPILSGADRAKLYFTLVLARQVSGDTLPSNFILVQLNPDSGSPFIYRP